MPYHGESFNDLLGLIEAGIDENEHEQGPYAQAYQDAREAAALAAGVSEEAERLAYQTNGLGYTIEEALGNDAAIRLHDGKRHIEKAVGQLSHVVDECLDSVAGDCEEIGRSAANILHQLGAVATVATNVEQATAIMVPHAQGANERYQYAVSGSDAESSYALSRASWRHVEEVGAMHQGVVVTTELVVGDVSRQAHSVMSQAEALAGKLAADAGEFDSLTVELREIAVRLEEMIARTATRHHESSELAAALRGLKDETDILVATTGATVDAIGGYVNPDRVIERAEDVIRGV